MFVQVFRGRVQQAAAVRTLSRRWVRDLAPTADGWLGSTAGVTDDGRFVVLARFASEAAARHNSDRPEQGAWWAEMVAQFQEDVRFSNSASVLLDAPGDPDAAGFVQVLQGRFREPAKALRLLAETAALRAEARPDILAGLTAEHGDGSFTMAVYFTSEDAARRGEQQPVPPELVERRRRIAALLDGTPEYYDLRSPWLDTRD